ncbi:MAG: TonB-dependent receptor [Pseudomonadota bacterium]
MKTGVGGIPLGRRPLATAVSLASLPLVLPAVHAQADESSANTIEEVIVTASRREESVQDIPINITAISDTMIDDLRLDGIAEIARYVPGLTVIDRGPRDEIPDIMVRGLNTDGLGPGFTSDTVAIYLGEVPLTVDLKPIDLERVEVLIGPQGTLYGQGTMGGAIRYIPKRAQADEFTVDLRADMYSNVESDGLSRSYGATFNVPIISDVLALRANIDELKDEGFIDYDFVVRESGVSNPEPDLTDPAAVRANLRSVEDANGEDARTARVNLRLTPNERFDANLWWYYQKNEAEGRQIVNRQSFGTGDFQSGLRYEEPNEYKNEMISLEVKADLEFAEATFVWGDSEYDEIGQRDQTDLLLNFEYGYEFFPTFSSFTREIATEDTETVEIRLTSQHQGPLQWVAGYFRNTLESYSTSEEFTPGFDQFAVDNFGGVALRPDSLEYFSIADQSEEERALYGELSFDINDSLTTTVGYRSYEFKVNSTSGFGLPLFETVFLGEPADAINVDLGDPNRGEDDGELLKFNVAWDVTANSMIYFTYSEGYRNGGVNSVPLCTPDQIASAQQQLCALADEILIDPDTIENYEVGLKGVYLDDRLSLNLAYYQIDWEDLQVADVTENGNLPITGNGSSAESKGLEASGRFIIDENWEVSFSYAYTNAELVADAPGLVGPLTALDGTRLPGHAEHAGTLNVTYSTVVFDDISLDVNYGVVYTGDIFNIPGGDEDTLIDDTGAPGDRGGEAIPSWDVHHLSATFARDNWRVQAYIDNVFDEYYILGTRTSRRFLQNERAGPGNSINGFTLRSYGQFVGLPRNMGVSVSYSF